MRERRKHPSLAVCLALLLVVSCLMPADQVVNFETAKERPALAAGEIVALHIEGSQGEPRDEGRRGAAADRGPVLSGDLERQIKDLATDREFQFLGDIISKRIDASKNERQQYRQLCDWFIGTVEPRDSTANVRFSYLQWISLVGSESKHMKCGTIFHDVKSMGDQTQPTLVSLLRAQSADGIDRAELNALVEIRSDHVRLYRVIARFRWTNNKWSLVYHHTEALD